MAARGTLFTTIRSEGGLLPPDLLARIATADGLDGLAAEDYGLEKGERLNETIASAWKHAQAYWTAWQATQESHDGAGISEMREQWLLPLFRELGYGRLTYRQAAEEIDGRRYVISHRAGEGDAPPVHTIAPTGNGDTTRSLLDHAPRADGSGPRRSPHGLLQEYLNRTSHLWGVVTDGRTLRLLRDNASLSRAAYVEVDLDAMFREGVYSDFVLLYLLLHRSRLPQDGQPVEEAWLEIWRRAGEASGARALDDLRGGVETAIKALGQGLIEHPANEALRQRLRSRELTVQDYYRQILRLVYRLLFLLAAEERALLFAPGADPRQKKIYRDFYGINRLRDLARRHSSDRHDDLWQVVQVLFRALREEESAALLGLAPLGGLFDSREMADLDGRGDAPPARMANQHLLTAMRGLGWVEANRTLRRINYRDMDVEELGSVYEGLLEQQPALRSSGERIEFALDVSGERKTTGSYYTNPGLVRELIRSALDPTIAAALAREGSKAEKRRHLLELKVCDPACGSGHFLLAAARRIGRALAEVDADGDEPSPADERAALREVIGHCVYGVDLNPLAVDLCKVALWLEGQHAGKPLQFLDHHVRHGNALIGATAAAMAEGIPDDAFDPVAGDSKPYAATIKKRNREERKKRRGQRALEELGWQVTNFTAEDARRSYLTTMRQDDRTLADVTAKAVRFAQRLSDPHVMRQRLQRDLWTASFFWPLQADEAPPPTDNVWRRLANDPALVDYLEQPELVPRPDHRTVHEACRLANDHAFFHWELEFEDVFSRPDPGFDVILCNPPWDRVKIPEPEFFASRDATVSSARTSAERKDLIAALRQTRPELHAEFEQAKRMLATESKFVRFSGRFPLTGGGELNTFSLFSEHAVRSIEYQGRAGLIVPTGLTTDDTNKRFFRWLIESRRIVSLFDFENREGLFPSVDSRMKFSLLTLGQASLPGGAFQAAFFLMQPVHIAESGRVFTLTPDEIALLNPNTRTCPIFRTSRDAEITKAIYGSAPVLFREADPEVDPWAIKFKRMFDMSKDSHLFRTLEQLETIGHSLDADGRLRGPDGAWERLYEAKMIHQYDHRFATYEQTSRAEDKARDTTLQEHEDPYFTVEPRYWVHEVAVQHSAVSSAGSVPAWLLGVRNIARVTDERSAIFSVIPLSAVGHSLQILMSSNDLRRQSVGMLANFNSIALDFVVRQKLGGVNFSFFILKQLPVLPPETYTPVLLDLITSRVLELVFTAWDLVPFARDLGYQGHPFPWDEERRALLRAELDGIYAHLYGLSREDFAYILDQFPIVKRKDEAAYGEYRTKRLCLEAYVYFSKPAQMRLWEAVREIETRVSHLVLQRLHNDIGAVPEPIQQGQEAERAKQGKPPRAATLSDFLGAGYLSLLPRVIKANRDAFADLFASNGQVDDRFSPLIGLRNALAHAKEDFLPDKLRASGEAEVRWFVEKLGLPIAIFSPPAIHR